MDYLLICQCMHLESNGEVFSLAFSDSADQPRRHVLLQKTLVPDEQDVALGLDGLQLEIDEQFRSAYRAISGIEVHEERARLFLTRHGQESLGYNSVVIALAGTDLRVAFGVLACVADDEFTVQLLTR